MTTQVKEISHEIGYKKVLRLISNKLKRVDNSLLKLEVTDSKVWKILRNTLINQLLGL